jgi:hypothetical protein
MSDRQRQRHARKCADAQQARTFGRALAGPYRGLPGTRYEGRTNRETLGVIQDMLGGPPERGKLYRVRFAQGLAGAPSQVIGEYVGLRRDMATGYPEPALGFVFRNPVLPANGGPGTSRNNPFPLWPLDIEYIAPAQPGDLDTLGHYQVEGEAVAQAPGPSRLQ